MLRRNLCLRSLSSSSSPPMMLRFIGSYLVLMILRKIEWLTLVFLIGSK